MRAKITATGLLVLLVACSGPIRQSLNFEASGPRGIHNGTSAAGKFENVGAFRNEGSFYCTGTLISPSVVLTAAHCVTDTVLPDLSFHRDLGVSEGGYVSDYKIHSKYSEFYTPNLPITKYFDSAATEALELPSGADVALVKLAARFSNFKPYSLGGSALTTNEALTAVGFGEDERGISGIRKMGAMKFDKYFLGVGLDSVSSSVVPPVITYSNFTDSVIHAVSADSSNQTICSGDSGGPLLRKSGDTISIMGIASWVSLESEVVGDESNIYFVPKNRCSRVLDNFHTAVEPFANWIRAEREKLDPSGACVGNDDQYGETLNGGCLLKQGTGGAVFSKAATISIDSTTVQRFGINAAVSYCDALTEGGYSDWQLPTKTQLEDASANGGFERLNLGAELYHWYWSSTASGLYPDSGTAVNLKLGQTHVGYPLHPNYPLAVVCVRNGT